MAMVELKGLHVVRSGGRRYTYAWRGGPRIKGEPGTPAFMAAYNEAVAAERLPETGRIRWVIAKYRASKDFQDLAQTTKRIWGRWLDRVAVEFGELSVRQFDRPQKVRPLIIRWRGTYAHQPRSADYAMQVLSRLCSFMVDPLALIASNPCEGIKQLYEVDRSEIIWTEGDIRQLRATASNEVMHAVDLAAATGLRTSDLFRLSWSHIQEDAIVLKTSKSRFKREAIVPLYDELRALLKNIPKVSTVILTNSRARSWKGFSSSFAGAIDDAKMADRDLHFHDLRGTAATRFYLAGFSNRVIGEILGWSEEDVEKIIRRYVGRQAAVKEAIELMRLRSGTKGVKLPVK